jgi:hypothetical protein
MQQAVARSGRGRGRQAAHAARRARSPAAGGGRRPRLLDGPRADGTDGNRPVACQSAAERQSFLFSARDRPADPIGAEPRAKLRDGPTRGVPGAAVAAEELRGCAGRRAGTGRTRGRASVLPPRSARTLTSGAPCAGITVVTGGGAGGPPATGALAEEAVRRRAAQSPPPLPRAAPPAPLPAAVQASAQQRGLPPAAEQRHAAAADDGGTRGTATTRQGGGRRRRRQARAGAPEANGAPPAEDTAVQEDAAAAAAPPPPSLSPVPDSVEVYLYDYDVPQLLPFCDPRNASYCVRGGRAAKGPRLPSLQCARPPPLNPGVGARAPALLRLLPTPIAPTAPARRPTGTGQSC